MLMKKRYINDKPQDPICIRCLIVWWEGWDWNIIYMELWHWYYCKILLPKMPNYKISIVLIEIKKKEDLRYTHKYILYK